MTWCINRWVSEEFPWLKIFLQAFVFQRVASGRKKVWCSLNYVWYNFFYIRHNFPYVLYSFWGVLKRGVDFGFAPFVGAYCIRPVRHRTNRIANRHRDIANRRNSGRMPYAPTAVELCRMTVCRVFGCEIRNARTLSCPNMGMPDLPFCRVKKTKKAGRVAAALPDVRKK